MKKIYQLEKQKLDIVFMLSLVLMSLVILLFIGSGRYVICEDSGSYIKLDNMEGVMPLYPLFLFFNQLVWGVERYLDIVIVEQALIAMGCIVLFVRCIKKRFALKYWESYLVFFMAIFPFTTDMPMAMTTQEIMTEGLAYALFYIFVILLLDAIWDKDSKKLIYAYLFVFVLALLRSQLQILFAVCGVAVIYICWVKCPKKNKLFLLVKMLGAIIICFFVMGTGILGVIKLNEGCQKAMYGDGKLAQLIQKYDISDEQLEKIGVEVTKKQQEEIDVGDLESIHQDEEVEDKSLVPSDVSAPNTAPEVVAFLEENYEDRGASVSQYDTLVFSKGMYEADYEDYLLFEEEQLQEQFLTVYRIVDELGYRYPYADSGLWGWKNVANATGGIGGPCFQELNKYFADYYNTTIVYFQYRCTAQTFRTIGITLLKNHFGSFLLHNLQLLPPAFIATVFFQKEEFYLLCHLVTLFLYVTAIGLMIWAFGDKKVDNKYAEFMLGVMLIDFILVIVLSLVFIVLQRYLVYAFGIFYVAYLLLIKQFWQYYGRCWIGKLIKKEH